MNNSALKALQSAERLRNWYTALQLAHVCAYVTGLQHVHFSMWLYQFGTFTKVHHILVNLLCHFIVSESVCV